LDLETLPLAAPEEVELFRLLHELNRQDGLSGICLRFGQARTILDLGLVGYTVLSCRTLGSALDVIYRYHSLTSDAYQVVLQDHEDGRSFRLWVRPAQRAYKTVIAEEFATGLWVALAALLPEASYMSRVRIDLAYSAPSYAEEYAELAPCEVRFSQPATSISMPIDWLELPVSTGDDTVERICRAQCDRLLEDMSPGREVIDDVRRLLLSVPSNRVLQLADIADSMMVSRRTLERRLHAAGSSFREIQLEVRMELAAHYVALGSVSGQEIGQLLGYSQPSAFYRAFKQHFSLTPTEYREHLEYDDYRDA
jgi:AraC-like DNA-binding protein